jgi:hypothetical protein
MPVCVPGSLPVFVGTVTTVAGRGSPADSAEREAGPFEIPYLVDSPPPTASPGASSGGHISSRAREYPGSHALYMGLTEFLPHPFCQRSRRSLGRFCIACFDHHADQRLRARRAHEHTALVAQ